jgi:DNA-binding NarL/FixJ family response regulator
MDKAVKNIIIVEDNEDIRMGFELLINATESYKVIAAFDSFENGYESIIDFKPHIILMDIDLPGINGIESTIRIKQKLPQTDIIIVTVFENSERVYDSLCAGATGYLTKTFSPKELLDALDEISKGGAPMTAKIARMIVSSFEKNRDTPLSVRETNVLNELAAGKSYKSIASELCVSLDTVKFHIKNIYSKLEVNNKEDAIFFAKQKKWL